MIDELDKDINATIFTFVLLLLDWLIFSLWDKK